MQGGASAFLRKPVLDRTLLDAISAATSSAQPGRNPEQPINSRWKHQPKSQFPRATAIAAARINNQYQCLGSPREWPPGPKTRQKNKNETKYQKCIWTAVIAAVAVCMTMSRAGAADNFGHGYVSSVTAVNGVRPIRHERRRHSVLGHPSRRHLQCDAQWRRRRRQHGLGRDHVGHCP